jgi:hypothetical protein
MGLSRGRNARAIWQDLVSEYGFGSSYQSVQRFDPCGCAPISVPVSDLENGKSKPRLAKFHSLSLIYECDINEILALFGLNIGDLDKEKGLIALPHTHLSGHALSRAEPSCSSSHASSRAICALFSCSAFVCATPKMR